MILPNGPIAVFRKLRRGAVGIGVAVMFLAGVLPVGASGQSSPLVLKAVIPLPQARGRMDHLSVDLRGKRLFVSEIGNGGVGVVSLATGGPVHLLTGFGEPQGTYFDDASGRLFVASGDDGTVKVFDGASYKLVDTAKFTSDADDLRFDPRTRGVIVGYSGQKFVGGQPVRGPGGEGDGALGYVTSNGNQGSLLPVDAHPEGFSIESDGARVYINVPDRHEIEVGDLAAHRVIARWHVSCTDNFPMALDEAGHRLFIGCRAPQEMLVIDTGTGKSVATIATPATTDDIFYDAARRRIYVLGGQGFVDVVQQRSPDAYTRLARVRARVGSRTGLFVPELKELFVAISESAGQRPELLVYEVR
jgi:DNA-binding beta-propeller fold protein YncE